MAATVEEIAAELDPETRAALIDNMKYFNDIAMPQDVGLNVADFEISADKGDIASQVPRIEAKEMSAAELAREMEDRGTNPTGFHSADAKALQKILDEERANKIAEIMESYAETLEAEKAALSVERNKTVMARLLAGEISSFETVTQQHVRTFCRLLLANQTQPRASFAILNYACPPPMAPQLPLLVGGGGPSNSNSLFSSTSSMGGMANNAKSIRSGGSGGNRTKLAAIGGSASTYISPDAAWLEQEQNHKYEIAPSVLASTSARVLAKCLCHNRSLKVLDLSESSLDDLGGSFLARALKHNAHLEHLELRGNALGPRTLTELAAALTPPSSSQEGEEKGGEEGEAGPETTKAPVDAGPMPTTGGWNTLRGLNLESNPLTGGGNDSSGIKAFANMLASNNTLRTLNFFRTDLDDFGVRLLVDGLRPNQSVHTCDVGATGDTSSFTERQVAEALKLNQVGLAALKASEQVTQQARAKEAAAAAAAAIKEERRIAYLQWMEDEKAQRVQERLQSFENERIARLEAEAKQKEDAKKAAEAKAAAEAGGGKKKKGKKKK